MKKGSISIAIIAVLFVAFIGVGVLYLQGSSTTGNELKKFSSYSELENFLKSSTGASSFYGSFGSGVATRAMTQAVAETATVGGMESDASKSAPSAAPAEEYSETNIQVADLNSLNAALAVIKWKKMFGFYKDYEQEHFCTYTIDGNHICNEDQL